MVGGLGAGEALNELVFPVRRLAPGGLLAWQQLVTSGYEGVAKDEASAYEGGATRR